MKITQKEAREIITNYENLMAEAHKRGMDVDLETGAFIPLNRDAPPRQWPEGDNEPQSPEQAGWDREDESQ